ncbi:probable magnesium transporter NIPA1 [Hyalella azteca]|uniref:Probable magnesium transporter NIPA1 n=1 Tax=Hyalella azteca TaxID=294128 RepID=A0A8B7PEL7_HYAAZ|nr:probable magnesium transporter NIPA1 [Hyalella azteca]
MASLYSASGSNDTQNQTLALLGLHNCTSLDSDGILSTAVLAEDVMVETMPLNSIIGVIIAVFANSLNGFSIILKKQSLKRLQDTGHLRASEGGFGYLKEARWWMGISLLGFGELLNFVALIFAPAILVTPLGVMALVTTTVLSPVILKEKTGTVGLLGCLLVLVGCVIITLCGPKDQEVASVQEFEDHLTSPGFLAYAGSIVLITSFLIYISPKYGSKYLLLYVFIVGSYGSLSVMFCKGIGIAIKTTILGVNAFTEWSVWVSIFCLIACLLIETAYNQVSLDLFNTSIVMSVTYVIFSTLIIAGSAIIFSSKQNIGTKDIILTVLGFIVNVIALYMMNLDKNPDMVLTISRNDEQCQSLEKIPVQDVEQTVGRTFDTNAISKQGEFISFSNASVLTPASTPRTSTNKHTCGMAIHSSMLREGETKNSYSSLLSDDAVSVTSKDGVVTSDNNRPDDTDKRPNSASSTASLSTNKISSLRSLCSFGYMQEIEVAKHSEETHSDEDDKNIEESKSSLGHSAEDSFAIDVSDNDGKVSRSNSRKKKTTKLLQKSAQATSIEI